MTAPPRSTPFVDGMAVILWLLRGPLAALRSNLGAVPAQVFEDLPDALSTYLPAIQAHRTGGASDAPRFYDQYWLNVQVWSGPEPALDWDAHRAAFELGHQVATVLFTAHESQTVTPYGSIAKWRESAGFRKFTDPQLPHIGRYVATYDLLIRNPRP